ncbi:MAG: transporter substrate-binding domain-containing protein [Bacteroidales bacterium]|nr:transporter substrate-binding domain-containing protein [Bacteroidales bacterium]MBN2818726.1 transporter substrate-binding domain-containing protein [Bacteroidales bacterium]
MGNKLMIIQFALLILIACKHNEKELKSDSTELTDAKKVEEKLIRLATAADSTTPSFKQGLVLYSEIFRRLGYKFQGECFPTERALLLVNNGTYDGEGGRIVEIDTAKYPNLVKVNESIFDVSLAAYSMNKDLNITGWNSFKKYPNLLIGIVNGSIESEVEISEHVDNNRIILANNTEQGFKMLAANRIDVFIDVNEYIMFFMQIHPEYKEMGIVNSGIIKTYNAYPYVNKKYSDLVPKIDSVLKELKNSGEYKQLLTQSFALSLKNSETKTH